MTNNLRDDLVALAAKWRDPSYLPANVFAANFMLRCADELDAITNTHRDELLGLVEDAARYRWLRDRKGCRGEDAWFFSTGAPILRGATIDAAIDAARHGRGE